MQKQQQQQMLKQQHQQRLEQEHQQRLEEQHQEIIRQNVVLSKQLEEKTRLKEVQLEQEKEQRQQQQQQLQQQQQHMIYSMPHPIHPQMLQMDPAIVYQQSMSPVLPRDSAIVSSQMKKLNINDTSNRSGNVDPAILFTQSSNSSRSQENSSRTLDPSMLFQQQQMNTSQQNFPFQDPAIISVTSTPEFTEPKKPLFGAKKMKKVAKEMVIFEDYSEFESGKGVVKKIQPKKNVESSSNISFKKKANNNIAGNETPSRTPPIMDASSKQNMVPISLIPPKARRSGSVTPQPQFTSKPVVVEPCRILTVSGGIQIPTVTSSQMEHAKQIASESGFTKSQLIENGAFGISMMVLKAIGGHRRIQPDNHNAAPVIVILTGPTSIGEFGIAAARHLANRGCQVIISIPEDSDEPTVEQYKALAKYSGARITTSINELPNQYTTPVDLIVDALLGPETRKISATVKSQMSWANANKAPVLSIDFPSGVNPDNGAFPANHYITPKWTLCLSAPYTGCTSRNVTGELFLADAGLSFLCFKSIISNFHIPWGSDFVLALEYA
ncbi:YjeF N-terminal domain-containing protein [Helicostylum pulchrum]|nr:YjeF N-terminal domain-containing protein [Helicostylum pulchrum]